uniref:C3H1-type domain-containing protein n=1 Tax=Photinus pyralis TaxID=7054 RepID=A0A1Y1KDS8_PHOPY
MGWRYYCDYCDKTFKDDLEARKKHLTSSLHIKLRKLHYEQHRDPRAILAEESTKTSCRRYIQHGECQFAGNCKYTHYSSEDLWKLKQRIAMEDYEAACRTQEMPEVATLESWVEKYNREHSKTIKTRPDSVEVHWSYPEYLECRTDLPPSLKKFKPEDFKDCQFGEWGV